jgi:nucleoside-diphosphate-sugar epimerase
MKGKPGRTHAGRGGLRVLVTGGTGFVGFHTARALHEAGHRLRLLVRSPGKMRRLFGPVGLVEIDHVVGDITDPGSVARALEGCDAVVHAAAMVNLQARDALETLRMNRRGTELVIGGAAKRGVGRIVQVSSITTLFNPGLDRIDEDSPLGTQTGGYGRSKVETEFFVRGLQACGAPVYTTYPGMIAGPDDPGLSEGNHGLLGLLDQFVLVTTGGVQIIDVRDLALAHLKLVERGGPPARYLLGGQFFRWAELGDILESLIGAPLRRIELPPWVVEGLGHVGDAVSRVLPLDLQLSHERACYATRWPPSDDSRALRELKLRYRDIRDTLADAIVWLADAGHLKHREFAAHIRAARAADRRASRHGAR